MANFIQFREDRYWNYSNNPYLEHYDNCLIRLCPGERYLQSVLIHGIDENVRPDFKVVDCKGNEYDSQFCYEIYNDIVYYDFVINEDTGEEPIFIEINDELFSNNFVVTEIDKCYTSFIQYKDTLSLCNCEADDLFYNSIRLRVTELDCEDADEFEQYFEVSTGNSRSSKAKQKTYKKWELIGDKLINDCFKEVYNSKELFINGYKQSKVEPFARGERQGDSNWSVTEFKTDCLDIEIIVPEVQVCCFSVEAGNNQVLPSGTTTVNLSGLVDDFYSIVTSTEWTQTEGVNGVITNTTQLNTTVTGLTDGVYTFQFCGNSDIQTKCDTVTITILEATQNGIPIEIVEAGCGVTPIVGWVTVYVLSMPLNNGDIIYTDISLTTPYVGNTNNYRVREGIIIPNYTFKVDATGLVYKKITCSNTSGGDAVVISADQSNSCESCMVVRVDVPLGDTRDVIISKTGIGIYGNVLPCGSGFVVNSDLTETITETKIYVLGIMGNNLGAGITSTTVISLTVISSNTVQLVREHLDPVQLC